MGYRFERWSIRPAKAPRVWRYCCGCGVPSEFVCSERFRTNAQKKYIDVWLKYRCSTCQVTWKLPVFERTAVASLSASLLDAFARHDPETVHRYACNLELLRLYSIRLVTDGEVTVRRVEVSDGTEGIEIALHVEGISELRLDRLLAAELQVSRAALTRGFEQERIKIEPARKDPLRRPICDGQRVRIDGTFPMSHNRQSADKTSTVRNI